MGEETGRKSPLRHAKTIAVLTIVLAISLAPGIALKFFPRETSALMLTPISSTIESRTGFPKETVDATWIIIFFVMATLTASALTLVLARALTASTMRSR
jgi:hypothetical protein